MKTIYVDLVMRDGKLVRIECPGKYEDELDDTLNTALMVGGTWSPDRFEGCRATYLGHYLSKVNMSLVAGVM